jgi:regulator of cell morphogenesis and NO signaling
MADTTALLGQVVSVHGVAHPELRAVEATWAELCRRMRAHLREERPALTPYVEPAEHAAPAPPASLLATQHEEVVALVRQISALTRGYLPPADACDAYRALYRDLAAFEADLEEHVHLADDVLRRDRSRRA